MAVAAAPPRAPDRPRIPTTEPASAAAFAEPGQLERHARALVDGALSQPQQARIVNRSRRDDRIAPLIEPDELRHDLSAVPRTITPNRVDAKSGSLAAHRHPKAERGGAGSGVTPKPAQG